MLSLEFQLLSYRKHRQSLQIVETRCKIQAAQLGQTFCAGREMSCHTWQFCKGICTPKQGSWLGMIGKGNPILSLKPHFLNQEFQFLPPITRSSNCFVFSSVPSLTLGSHPSQSKGISSLHHLPFSSSTQPRRH